MKRRLNIAFVGVLATISLSGCAVLAGAAAGGATGYVAGHEAGENEAQQTIDKQKRQEMDDDS